MVRLPIAFVNRSGDVAFHPLAIVALAIVIVAGCTSAAEMEEEPGEKAAPIAAAAPPGLVRLSAEAAKAIGLEVHPIERRAFRDSISATGWLQSIPGREETIKAPVPGYFVPRSEGDAVVVGTPLNAGQDLGVVRTLITPQEQAQLIVAKEEADTIIEQSRTTIAIAQAQLDRLKSNAEGIVAGTRLDELRETIAKARAAAEQAREKLPFLPAEPYDEATGAKPVPVRASITGRVTEVHVAPRQFIVQGDPLWAVADWSDLWLRVPLFERDYRRVLPDRPAEVEVPGSRAELAVDPVAVPQAVEPGTRTIDLYYHVPNASGDLRPGESLSVSLPVGVEQERAAVPRSALIWDGFGDAWVYIEDAPGVFRRTKVETGPRSGDMVAILRGVEPGRRVVTTGAEALYGEEFRGQLQAGDDD